MASTKNISVQDIRTGLPFGLYCRLKSLLNISQTKIDDLISINPQQLKRRRNSGFFNSNESDKIARIFRIYYLSIELFEGDKDLAISWLKEPSSILNHEPPLDYLDTELGARKIEGLILGLEFGEFQ